jgi:DNA-binding transcriptional regulator GbsR (MarR family)
MVARSGTCKEIKALADNVGDFVVHCGFKRVHGRICTHLVLSAEPLDAAELMKRLGISKALASMSLSEMIRYEVILAAGKSPRGTQVYRANPRIFSIIGKVIQMREHMMVTQIHHAAIAVRKLPHGQRKRLALHSKNVNSMESLAEGARGALERFLKNLRLDLTPLRSIRFSNDEGKKAARLSH